MHYLKTSIDFHRVIIFVETFDFVFMQYYFDEEVHNFQTDLPHGSGINTRSHKFVEIAIKESITCQKEVVNNLFRHSVAALGVKSTSEFLKSCQQVKDLRISKHSEDATIKLIETCKNEMLSIDKTFIMSLDTSPEKIASNQQLIGLARFCTDPLKLCIIGVDLAYNVGPCYITFKTYR